MNILFVHSFDSVSSVTTSYHSPTKPLHNQRGIHFGISYISAVLKSQGYTTDLLIMTRATNFQVIDQVITNCRPKLIGFTSTTTEYMFIKKIASYIKQNYPACYLLIGGHHASLNPESVIKGPFDAVCIGEGEYPALELAEQLKNGESPNNVQNLWIKTANGIERNTPREFIQNLDVLPLPDRDLWQKWILHPRRSPHTILLGRGCPYRCTYCHNHAMRKLAPGKYVRLRSVSNILQELEELILKFPETREVFFEVEMFNLNLPYARELCNQLQKFNSDKPYPMEFGINFRILSGKDFTSLFRSMKSANFRYINIGLESGSGRIRKEVLKRNYSNNDLIQTVKLAKKFGMAVNTYNMVGIPGETLADFKKTIKCNRVCSPKNAWLKIVFPYPGTDIHRMFKEKGLLNEQFDGRLEWIRAVAGFDGFSKKQILKEFQWFWYNVYRNHRPLYKLLAGILFWKIHTYPTLHRFYYNIDRYPIVRLVKNFFIQRFAMVR